MKEQNIDRSEADNFGKTLKHEVILLYTISLACDAMVFDIERRLRSVDRTTHLKHEARQRMTQYLDLIGKLKSHYEHFIAPSVMKIGEGNGYEDYETLRVYSQELLRLLMLYYEKCDTHDKHASAFDFLASLEGGKGVFTAADINRFDLGCNE